MHGDFVFFATFTMALVTAFAGGIIARKLGLPTIIGYLFAGLVIGPFTLGYVGDTNLMNQLAEIGVIFMMFGVGLHFSLKDLWAVRTVAIPGAALQISLGTIFGLLLTMSWGWSFSAGLVTGMAISVASTVVLLRGLADHNLTTTIHGQVAVGWLVFEDLVTVAILVLMPVFFGPETAGENDLFEIVWVIGLSILFIVFMLFIGARFMPWLLSRIALTRSRELFILAIVALALGTAFGAAQLFGMSLALGAFLAGVVIGESDIGHQVGAEVVPFQDVFQILFFVSVGMLVNPITVINNWWHVLLLTFLVIGGKWLINLLLGLFLPSSGRTILVVAAGLSQIGEFTFLVGALGVTLGVLTGDQYSLILAAAVFSIMLNPFMFNWIPAQERFLKQRFPRFWARLDKSGKMPEPVDTSMKGHVIIVGYGRVGRYIGRVLQQLHLPFLIVESDAVVASNMQKAGLNTLFGDAANSEILTHTGLSDARALVVTMSDETTAELVVASAHEMAPDVPIIARASTETGVHRLAARGAHHIIHPELEGGLEVMRHTLLALNYPAGQIQSYIDAVRGDAYSAIAAEGARPFVLDQLITATRGVEITWLPVSEKSDVVGKSIKNANLRARVGASVIALVRDKEVIPNPKSDTEFHVGDMVGVIGSAQELAAMASLLDPEPAELPKPSPDLDTEGFEMLGAT